MKKLLLLLVALCASAFTAEISGHGYRVTSDQAGTRIYYQGILLQTNVFPSIVEGPGWKRALLDDHDIRKATAVVNAENQLEITYPGKTKEATGHLKIAISEAGVALTYSFEDTVAEVGVADLWFCALPLERFANQKYVVGNGDKEGILPTTKELETEKKSKWRLHNDTKRVVIECAEGTMEITGDTYFHLFDGRFHAFKNTILCRSINNMQPGNVYNFNIKFSENQQAQDAKANYTVKADNSGMVIAYKGHAIQQHSWPTVVQGPGWNKVLMDDKRFHKNATVTVNGSVTTMTATDNGVTITMTAEVQADGVELTYRYDTDLTPLHVADLFFGCLPLDDCAERTYTIGGKPAPKALPTTIEKETEKKSKWRLHNDTKEIAIQMPYGTLTISGDYMHLFDARFHGHLPAKGRTIAIRTDNHLKAGQNYRFKFSVKE